MTISLEEQEKIAEDLRFRLLRKHDFFGSLIHRTKIHVVESTKKLVGEDVPAFATPGHIYFHQNFINTADADAKLSVFAHELLHNTFLHPERMFKLAGKDKQQRFLANAAADYLVNALVKEMGLKMLPDMLYEEQFSPDKHTLESLYAYLKKIAPPSMGGKGEKPPKGGSSAPQLQKFKPDLGEGDGEGEGADGSNGLSEADIQEAEAEIRGIIEAAANNLRQAGKGSAMLDRMIDLWKKVHIPWEVILQEWMERKVKDETTWTSPHRRTHSLGVYLPTRKGTKMGKIGVAIDLSGSISDKECAIFLGNLDYVFQRCRPSGVEIITFDSRVCSVQNFEDELPNIKDIKLIGGGGTDFRPPLKHFEKVHAELGEDFEGLIFMTDLCGPFPEKKPSYDVVFLSILPGVDAPFGVTIDASAVRETNS